MLLYSFLTPLDEEDGGEDEEATSQRCESDVAEVVPQQDEHRHQTEAKPPCQAA
jgi:hypothetical protein